MLRNSRFAVPLATVPVVVILTVCAPRPPAPPPAAEPVPEEQRSAPQVEVATDGAESLEKAAPPMSRPEPMTPAPQPPHRPLPSANDRARGAAELQRAARLRSGRDWRAAAAAFRSTGELLPLIDDWTRLLEAEMLGRLGDTTAVRTRLEGADPLRAREWGWRVHETAFLVAGDTAAAIRALDAASAEVRDPARRALVFRKLGELQQRRGNTPAAVSAYRRAMEIAPAAVAAREAAAAMANLERGPWDRLLEGRVWLRHGNVDRGIAGLEAYLAGGRGEPAVNAEVRLEAGRALFNARRHRDAERFLLIAAREPAAAPAVAAEAQFIAARSQFRDGRTELARNSFLATAERFPQEQAAAQALFILGDLEQDAGRTTAARDLFRRGATTAPQFPEAVLSAVRYAGILFLAGDHETAATFLDDVEARRTRDRHSAPVLYWAGRAHQTVGRVSLARDRFEATRDVDPVSYYGQLAASRLGGSLADIPLRASPREDDRTQQSVDAALLRVDLLREADLAELSTLEMELARVELESLPAVLYRIAEAHLERGAPVAGMLLGREIQRSEGSWNPRLLRIVFPFPHRELIEAEARRNGLDPFVVAGLIRQESMFNPIAVSSAGAIGLMQIMPATGRQLARRAGVTNFDPAMLRRPELNVRLGTLFLADLLQRSGNRTEAFAAYNAGPSRAARWRQFPEFRDEELFAERIPFAETRDYVKILDFNARLYRMLYGS